DGMLHRAGLPIGRKTYTFPEVIHAARAAGVTLEYRAGATRSVIHAELTAGRPVISLLRYGEISGNQDDFDGAHFWLCIGFDLDAVYVHDPNWWEPRRAEGAARRIPNAEFDRAIGEPLRETGNQPFQALLYRG